MSATQSGFVSINGARVYYEVAGEGHALVMVHAGIADNRMWDDQFAFFAHQYKVVRYDLRGFGQTLPVEGDFKSHEDLRALMDFLNIESAYLMGCSMGGTTCINFALEYPDRADALILVGAAPGDFAFEGTSPPQWALLDAEFNKGNLEGVSELVVQVTVDGRGRAPGQVNPALRKKVFDMKLLSLGYMNMKQGGELGTETPSARLGELHLPGLVIIGDLDTDYAIAAADFMVANISGAHKIVMRGTAHVPNMEFPNEFNAYVQAFLSGLHS